MLGDVDGDGSLDAVVAVTSSEGEGQLWAVSAATGETLQNFPVRLNNRCVSSAPVCAVCGVWCVVCSVLPSLGQRHLCFTQRLSCSVDVSREDRLMHRSYFCSLWRMYENMVIILCLYLPVSTTAEHY